MKRKLNCIMLVDDNFDDNFFHKREIIKENPKHTVVVRTSGMEALDYLRESKDPHSDLIFLDINMPGMNGWEFLQEYNNLAPDLKNHTIIIMLTTSDDQSDVAKAKEFSFVADYITKPLTRQKMELIEKEHFLN